MLRMNKLFVLHNLFKHVSNARIQKLLLLLLTSMSLCRKNLSG